MLVDIGSWLRAQTVHKVEHTHLSMHMRVKPVQKVLKAWRWSSMAGKGCGLLRKYASQQLTSLRHQGWRNKDRSYQGWRNIQLSSSSSLPVCCRAGSLHSCVDRPACCGCTMAGT